MKLKNLSFKVVGFWCAMAAITIIFAILFISNLTKVRVFDSYKDIKKADLALVDDEILKQKGTYYVYVYSLDSEKNVEKRQDLEPVIFNYFTYVSLEEKGNPIYGYCVDDFSLDYAYGSVYKYLGQFNSEIKAANAPLLIKVSNGSVSNVYYEITKIEKELQTQMK